ncbi:unnamed protein product [Notodromas monacha]|uniref:Uncharacterized protein n=1 Tax=Notodromas monacha TaxID=399045 RepID=A0A7R9BGF8_9CRUS|nr:unnamed protein product [Notodromas monacha]CAG0913666.1 unnamed protein product [Notodromas monacha]
MKSMGDAGVTLTVRVIRSFQHRNVRPIVLKNVDLNSCVEDFLALVKDSIGENASLPPPVKKYDYDSLKIEHKAHGAKTSDPLINTFDDDKLLLKPGKTLRQSGVENECEVSLFKWTDYVAYVRSKTEV